MKKQLDRTKRLAAVLKQMHELEAVRLAEAGRSLTKSREEEQALIDAITDCQIWQPSFAYSTGKRLDAASRRAERAATDYERIQAECLKTRIKHSTLDRQVDRLDAVWLEGRQRAELAAVIDAYVASSVPQGGSDRVQSPPTTKPISNPGENDSND